MKKQKTDRGFSYIEFDDMYEDRCTLQKSSLATEHCIWFGINEVKPMIMAKDTPEGGVGWVDYPIPEEVSLSSRMHLTRKQVLKVLPHLIKFVLTGKI